MKQVKLPKILNQIATGPKTEPIAAVPWSWEIVQTKKKQMVQVLYVLSIW